MPQTLIRVMCLLVIWSSHPAEAAQLITKMSRDSIPVHPNFQGQEIALFGTVTGEKISKAHQTSRNVVIAIRGPRENNIIQKKVRWMGIWLNGNRRVYQNIPSFLMVLSNRPINAFIDIHEQRTLQVNSNALFLASAPEKVEKNPYREALARLKHDSGFFVEQAKAVEFLDNNTFFASAFLPDNLPIGRYRIDFYYFQNGQKIAENSQTLNVYREGLSEDIFSLSRSQPMIYGIVTLIILISIAYLMHSLTRKD